MLKRKRVTYSELSPSIMAIVPESAFLKAFDVAESQTVVVWYVDSKLKRQHEVEFSRARGRLLSRLERESVFPAERELVRPGDGVKVRIGNRLEQDTDVRYETYVAVDPVTGTKLAETEQIFYAPFLLDPEAVVRAAIQKTNFPATYARWSPVEKIQYWVGALYRIRRQTGEGGRSEDEAFSPALLAKMRTIDPNVDGILAPILAELSRMEMVSPDVMRAAFSRRVGVSI